MVGTRTHVESANTFSTTHGCSVSKFQIKSIKSIFAYLMEKSTLDYEVYLTVNSWSLLISI